jgi:hypothetical protein
MDNDSYSTGTLQSTNGQRVIAQEPYSLSMDNDSYSTGTLQSINGQRVIAQALIDCKVPVL